MTETEKILQAIESLNRRLDYLGIPQARQAGKATALSLPVGPDRKAAVKALNAAVKNAAKERQK